jgi:hypothetical protein
LKVAVFNASEDTELYKDSRHTKRFFSSTTFMKKGEF